jgi:molybdate transport repressor ModE-like protein
VDHAPRDRWLGVELRHLAAIAAIAGEGSVSRAADRLGYVQSSVSEQLATLEHVVGARLVERSPGTRPLALTPAGKLLVRCADDILARLAAARAEFAGLIGDSDEMARGAAGSSWACEPTAHDP